MDALGGSTWLWIGFSLFILTMLSLDLGLFNRKAHTVKYREAWIWSAVWVALAMGFAGIVFYYLGSQSGVEFLTGFAGEEVAGGSGGLPANRGTSRTRAGRR